VRLRDRSLSLAPLPAIALLFASFAPSCSSDGSSPASPPIATPTDAGSDEVSTDAFDEEASTDASTGGSGGGAGAAGSAGNAGSGGAAGGSQARAVKVMIIDMSGIEALGIVSALGLTEKVPVPGLSKSDPNVHCNADDVCQLTTGMGYANAAASMTALVLRGGFDLTRTYFVIAGIAGIDPAQGTLGTAAWARYVVDVGYAYEIDAREMPSGFPYGYFGIGASTPSDLPSNDYASAVVQLDEDLLQAVLSLTKGVTLGDAPDAQAFRAHYPSAPANQPPVVTQCDIASSDTWFAGKALTSRARDFTTLVTGGKGVFCMSAQEDNATLEVLRRADASGKLSLHRVAALRTASDLSAPYPGQSDSDGLLGSLTQGGLGPSTGNLSLVVTPVVNAIVQSWATWKDGPPKG
jgi:purine nucleoside permease